MVHERQNKIEDRQNRIDTVLRVVASKKDLEGLNQKIDGGLAELNSKMDGLHAELLQGILGSKTPAPPESPPNLSAHPHDHHLEPQAAYQHAEPPPTRPESEPPFIYKPPHARAQFQLQPINGE